MIALVGNAPSSGSTLLADLLDSTVHSACGVELNLFSNKKIYDFPSFKKNIRATSAASSIYKIRNGLNFHRLHSYDLSAGDFERMTAGAADLNGFVDDFARRFLVFRGKNEGGILFEKTPENINCLPEFLQAFPGSWFIHIVRNPLYIYPSLRKRRFPPYISLTTWLIDAGKFIKYMNHPRLIPLTYEQLVATPFRTTAGVLQKTAGLNLAEQEIQKGYETNDYRRLSSKKITSWKVNSYGTIENANTTVPDEETLRDLAGLLNVKISSRYARHFDLAELSFLEAVKTLGYFDDVMEKLSPHAKTARPLKKTVEDYLRLGLKWEEDLRHGDAEPADLNIYLNPVEPVG